MHNLALGRPATQSSVSFWSTDSNPEIDAAVANNGDIESDIFFHTDNELHPWWQVDLQDSFLIRRIVIFNRLHTEHRFTNFTVLRSIEGKHWTAFFNKNDGQQFDASEPYVIEINGNLLARFIRIQLNGAGCLHLRECQVFGERPESALRARLAAEEAEAIEQRFAVPAGQNGRIVEIGRFLVLNDTDRYSEFIASTLDQGSYEGQERALVAGFVMPDDRVIEAGTAIGTLAMTAASIVGPESVLTFDANPLIVDAARDNFQRNGLSEIQSHVGVLKNRNRVSSSHETVDFYIDVDFWGSRLDATPTTEGIVGVVNVPVFCLEDEIQRHNASVLLCDIEGGEVDLLTEADLTGIRLIIMETHYSTIGEQPTDRMMRMLIAQGFNLNLDVSSGGVVLLRRDGSY